MGPFYLDLQLDNFHWKKPYIKEKTNATKKSKQDYKMTEIQQRPTGK